MASVRTPNWFQAGNGDVRYQLTIIGGHFAQATLSKESENTQFTISTTASNVKMLRGLEPPTAIG